MADHDNSIASQMEDWLVARIRLIRDGGELVFESSEVRAWEGSMAGEAEQFAKEFFQAKRGLSCRVFYHSDRTVDLEEGDLRVVPQYVVLVGVKNNRPDAARRGDGTTIGTNRLRDLLQYALHKQRPGVNDGVSYVDMTYFRGSRVVYNDSNGAIQRTTIEVDESEKE